MKTGSSLNLKWNFAFEDLYRREGLERLDAIFCEHLQSTDAALHVRWIEAREHSLERKQNADLIVDLAPHVEDFVVELFGITAEARELQSRHAEFEPMLALKRKFVQKKAISGVTKEQAMAIDGAALAAELVALFNGPLTEENFVEHVSKWLDDEANHAAQLKVAQQYAAWAALSPAGIKKHRGGVLFRVPHKLDAEHLVDIEVVEIDGVPRIEIGGHHLRHREGFKLTDPGYGSQGRARSGALLHQVSQPAEGFSARPD